MKLHEAHAVVRLSKERATASHHLTVIRSNGGANALEIAVSVCGKPVLGDDLFGIHAVVRNHLDRQLTLELQAIEDRLEELGFEKD